MGGGKYAVTPAVEIVRHRLWAPNILLVVSFFPQHMSIKSKDFSFYMKMVGNCTRGILIGGYMFWGVIVLLAIAHRELSGGNCPGGQMY